MPLTVLDATTALILVDLQKAVRRPGVEFAAVVDNASLLANAFRLRGLPVVLVNVAGGAPGRTDSSATRASKGRRERAVGWTDLLPELGSDRDDVLITKLRWGAFHDTVLDRELRSRSVTQVVLGGVSTSIGVESTARAAYEHGYNVILATDAMFDSNAESHSNSIDRIFPRLGETTTTPLILDALNTMSPA